MNRKATRWGYVAIEVNLLLWLVMGGMLWGKDGAGEASTLAWIGIGWAAIAQHWAYYRLLKGAPGEARPSPAP